MLTRIRLAPDEMREEPGFYITNPIRGLSSKIFAPRQGLMRVQLARLAFPTSTPARLPRACKNGASPSVNGLLSIKRDCARATVCKKLLIRLMEPSLNHHLYMDYMRRRYPYHFKGHFPQGQKGQKF